MKLPLASSMVQEREGRTGANRAEDWSARPPRELGTRQCYGRCCGAGGERILMSMEEPAERRGEEVESFEAQAASVPAAGAREDWPLRESSFEFDASSGQVVAYEHRGVGPAV